MLCVAYLTCVSVRRANGGVLVSCRLSCAFVAGAVIRFISNHHGPHTGLSGRQDEKGGQGSPSPGRG